MTLSGKKILITGASSGIGSALAHELYERGAKLYLVARREERLVELAQKLNAQYLVADITNSNFLSQLQDTWGLEFDGLINNAGLAIGKSHVADSDPNDWDAMLETNVTALFRLTHAVLPSMLKNQHGDILNVCSIAGHLSYAGGAVYCATKHAVSAFTKALREETCGQNVRVMQISPGMVETEFSLVRFQGDKSKAQDVYQGMTPLTAQDIARQMIFMLEQPRHVCIDEIVTMPTDQGSPNKVVRRKM
jgi:3-hydroxy acid dehydrogenase / malonic semialdehyde reductase